MTHKQRLIETLIAFGFTQNSSDIWSEQFSLGDKSYVIDPWLPDLSGIMQESYRIALRNVTFIFDKDGNYVDIVTDPLSVGRIGYCGPFGKQIG